MNTPHLYYVPELLEWANENQTHHPEAGFIPVRPLGFQGLSLKIRLKLAWAVFTGKYDAVYWEPKLKDVWTPEDNSDLNALLKQATQSVQNWPGKVDLSGKLPPVEDQGEVNASSALAMSAVLSATGLEGAGIAPFMYYNERHIDQHNKEQK